MINVLIISYYFPPEGGPAVQRVSKFVKYLPDHGFNPIILTSKRPLRVYDSDLFNELPENLLIFRIADWAAYLPGEIIRYIKKWLYPDKHSLWINPAYRKAIRIISKYNIKLIFTSSPPHSSQMIAHKIKMILPIPYIADLRDEWSDNPDFNKWNRPMDQINLEKILLGQASYITTICNGAAARLAKISGHDRVEAIFNGYDRDDYPDINPIVSNKAIVFAYGGRLSDKTSPRTFFKAASELIDEDRIDSQSIKINVWGTNSKENWLSKTDVLNHITHFIQYLPHREYINAIINADVLLLFVTKIKDSDILTGKVFEYIYFNKPILAVIEKDCELNQILSGYGNAYIYYNHDLEEIKSVIVKINDLWKQNSLGKPVSPDYLNRFDRRIQTKQLADLFRKCLNI